MFVVLCDCLVDVVVKVFVHLRGDVPAISLSHVEPVYCGCDRGNGNVEVVLEFVIIVEPTVVVWVVVVSLCR